jgi:hypothetical protein
VAALTCPACGRRSDGAGTMCPGCLIPFVPADETTAGAARPGAAPSPAGCPEPGCGTALDPRGRCPVHAIGAPRIEVPARPADPVVRFPWGIVDIGGEPLRIGRPGTGPLRSYLTDDTYGNVSGRHAELWRDAGRLYVWDLGSLNGTFVNGARLEPYTPRALAAGDAVRFAADLHVTVVSPPGPEAAR